MTPSNHWRSQRLCSEQLMIMSRLGAAMITLSGKQRSETAEGVSYAREEFSRPRA